MLLSYLIRHTEIRRNACIRNYNIQCVSNVEPILHRFNDILLMLL